MGDEASARTLLAEMQARLGRDPHEALGLVGSPTAADVRNAFLTLTKTYHPAKFARMSSETQRLANEVFLSLRAAHDTLSKASPPIRKSGPLPTLQQMRAAPGQVPPATPNRPPTGQVPTIPQAPATAPRTPNAAPRTPTAGQNATQPMRPFANPRPGTPLGRAPSPQSPDPERPPQRIAQPSPPPGQVRPQAAAVPTGNPDRELAPILELIKLGQLAAAKVALETLTTRSPNIPRYQSLLHYARGREAQLAKRLDEARVELQDALQIDPDLALAKTALAELFTRRR